MRRTSISCTAAWLSLTLPLIVAALPICAGASTVRQVTLGEMLQASALVFEGRVVATEPRLDSDGSIRTYISFQILDVIKGEYSGRLIELPFLGGTIGNVTLNIGDMHFPTQDEAGIYFVESLSRRQVHPLYGWDQGRLLVKVDKRSGKRMMSTANNKPVVEIDLSSSPKGSGLTTGAALGIHEGAESESQSAWEVEEFKYRLRDFLRWGK